MPLINYMLPETYQSITRPVAVSILKQVLANSGIHDQTFVGFFGDQQVLRLTNSGWLEEGVGPQFDQRQAVFVKHQELEYEPTLIAQNSTTKDQKYLFLDTDLGIAYRPVTTTMEVTLSFTFRSEDKQDAVRWRDNFVRQLRNNKAHQLHKVSYQYPFPPAAFATLLELHRLRENKQGYAEDFGVYWKNHAALEKFTFITKLDGSEMEPYVQEDQINVQGWFRDTLPSEPSKTTGATYEATFDFVFQYQRPISIIGKIPVLVHQQPVPAKLYDRLPSYKPEALADKGFIDEILDTPRSFSWLTKDYTVGITIPHYDDWLPKYPNANYLNIVTSLLVLNPDTPRNVLNLTQLGDYEIVPELLEYLKEERAFLFGANNCPVQVEIYEGNVPLDYTLLSMDENFQITCSRDLDPRLQYRFRFNVLWGLDLLDTQTELRFRQHPTVCLKVLRWVYPPMQNQGLTPRVIANRLVEKEGYDKVLGRLRKIGQQRATSFEVRWWMFNELLIKTRRGRLA
jgi:hypothetical protein